LKKAHLQDIIQNINERKKYADRIYNLVCCWLIGIGVIIFYQGLWPEWKIFHLSDKMLITLIGGTTINILGIFVIVTKYLFRDLFQSSLTDKSLPPAMESPKRQIKL